MFMELHFFLSLLRRAEVYLKTAPPESQVTTELQQFPETDPSNPRQQMLSLLLQFSQSPENTLVINSYIWDHNSDYIRKALPPVKEAKKNKRRICWCMYHVVPSTASHVHSTSKSILTESQWRWCRDAAVAKYWPSKPIVLNIPLLVCKGNLSCPVS